MAGQFIRFVRVAAWSARTCLSPHWFLARICLCCLLLGFFPPFICIIITIKKTNFFFWLYLVVHSSSTCSISFKSISFHSNFSQSMSTATKQTTALLLRWVFWPLSSVLWVTNKRVDHHPLSFKLMTESRLPSHAQLCPSCVALLQPFSVAGPSECGRPTVSAMNCQRLTSSGQEGVPRRRLVQHFQLSSHTCE